MATAFILSETTVQGADVLAQARAEIKKLVPLGVRIPKMEVKGDWVMNGFDFSFEDWQPAFLPLGNKYVRAGERKAQVEPTETSELRIFFVVAGEALQRRTTRFRRLICSQRQSRKRRRTTTRRKRTTTTTSDVREVR